MKSSPLHKIEEFSYHGTEKNFYANSLARHIKKYGDQQVIPHKNNFYATVLITKGRGTYTIDFKTYHIKPGQIYLMCPGPMHTSQASTDLDGYIILHTKEFFDLNFTYQRLDQFPFFRNGNPPLIKLELKTRAQIEPLFQDILRVFLSEQTLKFQKICSLLNIMYIKLAHLHPQAYPGTDKNEHRHIQIQQLEDFIDNNYKSYKLPRHYALMMNMSLGNLNRQVRANLNETISTLISDRVVLEAKRMLLNSVLSVSQIAFELGYLDTSYFFRIFKSKCGYTPLEFVKMFKVN